MNEFLRVINSLFSSGRYEKYYPRGIHISLLRAGDIAVIFVAVGVILIQVQACTSDPKKTRKKNEHEHYFCSQPALFRCRHAPPTRRKREKKMSMSITFAPSLPYNGTEEGDFLEGGGDKFSGIEHCHSFRDIDLKFCRHVLLV